MPIHDFGSAIVPSSCPDLSSLRMFNFEGFEGFFLNIFIEVTKLQPPQGFGI
jgi:hypothetical protein